eukprot:Blabericola_migrator_1__10922@NODE_630_length_7163_cov_61_195603_g461_i0_p4_GENE_NODE_630_length_7163_cov_61_195603_g461_i0NODE_630_length_7163_cov_61_195603_g461_i0_p4_ORF_typecomplete_len121_score28_95Aconitase/PF00330_20/0_14AAA_26/PF13500_6/0_17Peptidase_C11/PF03415_14/0_18_NODE_630_length_7163_cov_61_195603_g461_i025532915
MRYGIFVAWLFVTVIGAANMNATDIAQELSKIEILHQHGYPIKIIISFKENVDPQQVAERICDKLTEYGAKVGAILPAINMAIIEFGEGKAVDSKVLEIMKDDPEVMLCEIDSVVKTQDQ